MSATKFFAEIKQSKCPGCGWVIAQKLLGAARVDFECPQCGEHTLSEFTPDISSIIQTKPAE